MVFQKSRFLKSYDECLPTDLSSLFQLVRTLTRDILGRTRPGILLGLAELGFDRGSFVGGFHYATTNEIFLNKSALRVMKEESQPTLFKAYVFFLLLHEYIHAVGIYNERLTRELTNKVISVAFPPNHPVSLLTLKGLDYFFPYSFRKRTLKPSREDLAELEFVRLVHPDSEFTYQ